MTYGIIPTLRYEDAYAMIAWLERAFDFRRGLVVDDDHGGIAHAQLVRDGAMIMLGSARDDEFGMAVRTPRALGGATQGAYIIVADDDVDTLAMRAAGVGARIIMGPRDEDYGGRHFTCVDPEGHVWSIGSYDPFAV